jgi:hypothetical protein
MAAVHKKSVRLSRIPRRIQIPNSIAPPREGHRSTPPAGEYAGGRRADELYIWALMGRGD